jgi:hypothetical protein
LSRRNRILTWLAGILILLGLGYASVPWLLATAVKHTLAAQGLRDIQLKFDYPHWHGIRLRALAFTAETAAQQFRVQVPAAEIQYHFSGLVKGRLDRILVPMAILNVQPAAHTGASVPINTAGQNAALPPAALLSGHWLAQLPLRELSLQQLKVTWRTAPKTTYALQLTGQLKNARLELKGDIKLPQLPKRIAFSLHAGHTGQADLILSSVADAMTPLLKVSVTSVDVEHEPRQVNGELHTRLQSWVPVLRPWLKQMQQITGVAGELQSQWRVQLNGSAWQLTGEATLHGLSGRWRDKLMPSSEVTAKYSADAKQATLQASLTTAKKAVVVQIDGTQQFAEGRGHARIKLLPLVFKKKALVLSQLFTSWPYPFDVDTGRASAAVQLRWSKLVTSTVQIYLDQIGGHYNKVAFRGVKGEMALTLNKGIATSKTAQLHVAMLDVGFPVENIAAKFTLQAHAGELLPVIKMQKVSAKLLGGKAASGPFELDFSRDKNEFVVQLEHIDMDKIMQLEQQEGLQASGLLDGQLPLSLSREGIAVADGQLAVRAPGGVIHYTPTPKVVSLAQSNPSVNMVVEALRNFQYQVMDVHSDYKANGDLKLRVHIEGRNPDWQAGKPVHLNLNLQENIPVLLRSLQLSGEISERLRQHYQTAP